MPSLVPGNLYVLKATGERVIYLYPQPGNLFSVRRPVVTENGTITHVVEDFTQPEIITQDEHADAQLQEAILKAKIGKQLEEAVTKLEQDDQINKAVGQLAAQDKPTNKVN